MSALVPQAIKQWSLTSLREKLVKIGAKVVRHGLCVPKIRFCNIGGEGHQELGMT